MITSYEIEFLPVGNGEKSGDCILFHYFEDGIEKIIAYDGGTRKSGEAMVAHIKKYYGTQKIDYLINSHPDGDHVSGLIYVLENIIQIKSFKNLYFGKNFNFDFLCFNSRIL